MEMIDYVLKTSDKLHEMIENHKKLVQSLVQQFKLSSATSIKVIASGSSYNATMIALPFMRAKLHLPITVETPEQYLLAGFEEEEAPFVITISQSGASTNVIKALEKMGKADRLRILVTSQPDSLAAQHADLICDYGIGTETVEFVTMGLTGLICYLALFALNASDDDEAATLSALHELADDYATAVNRATRFFKAQTLSLAKMKDIFVCGNNMNLGVAREGALKIQETLKKAARHYEVEEFLHGPAYQMSPESTVFIIDDPTPSPRIKKIYEALDLVVTQRYLVTEASAYGDIQLPSSPLPLLSGLINVAVFQTICALLMPEMASEPINPFTQKFQAEVAIKAYAK